ncbi:hypothetical protein F3N42_09975 [Marinihelvus fidelis]|uniref:Lysophospholipid acyltransferase family protein n=1 Tax=Marinihelvus fidelis TaxID=2613842 RepID=A0A5N0T9K8_9GAMM|nr:hypothetical protein [Marinihelvus fidelis]KAA9131632.1 hypothetical protein F3N42_09975 [Marinihelvus fidelis]
MRWILRQCHDLAAYWLLPLLCFALPARGANVIIRAVGRSSLFYRGHVMHALRNAGEVLGDVDAESWAYTLRVVRFLDAVDAWHGRYSSTRRINETLVHGPESWPRVESIVMMGAHLGPATLSLRCMADAGLKPVIVYRDVTGEERRRAPLYHLYQVWRIRYLLRICTGGAIRVPGGSGALAEAIGRPGCAIVFVPDAPAASARGDKLKLLGHDLPINARGLDLVVASQAPAATFGMFWDDALGKRVLEVSEPVRFDDLDAAIGRVNAFVADLLDRHTAQWHLWATEIPVLVKP